MNKKFSLIQGLGVIVLAIVVLPFIGKLIFVPSEKKVSNNIQNNYQNTVIEIKPETIIDTKLSKLNQFLKYEKNKNIEYLEKFNIELEITTSLDGKILDENYKIPLFSSIEANPRNLVRHFKPEYKVEILDYKYEKPITGFDSFSRCKIKKVGDSNDKSGWLNCGWIDISLARKISTTQKNNLWNFCRKNLICSSYGKRNFYTTMRLGLKKEDVDSVKRPVYDIYSKADKKEIIGKYSAPEYFASFILLDYNYPSKMCKIEWLELGKNIKSGWLSCNKINIH